MDSNWIRPNLSQVDELMKQTLEAILNALNLMEFYQDLMDLLTSESSQPLESSRYRLEEGFQRDYIRIGEWEQPCSSLRLTGLATVPSYATVEFRLPTQKYTIRIEDEIYGETVLVFFDQEQTEVVIQTLTGMGSQPIIHLSESTVIEGDSRKYSYVIWLLTAIGDYFYDFED